MSETLRIGVIGAGKVFERLYGPALRRAEGLKLVAVADPSEEARWRLEPGVSAYARAEEMVAGATLDGVIVLSPGALHVEHAALALGAGVPVLLEKPSARSVGELEGWPAAWRGMVTAARPRRYWPRYLELRRTLEGREFRLVLRTSPAGWGATHTELVEDDLLPHVTDLAGWLSGSEVAGLTGEAHGGRAEGSLQLEDGRTVSFVVEHGDRYEEYVVMGQTEWWLDVQTWRERLEARLGRKPPQDVLGVSRMLRLWGKRLRGEDVNGLPGFETALLEVRLREALRGGGTG